MAFTRIHHVGMITPDLEVAQKAFCEGFGLAVDERRSPLPGGRPGSFDNVTTIEMPIGEMYLEISRPNDDTGEAAQFLAQRSAGGMHHLCLASDDLANDVARLQQNGLAIRPDMAANWDGRSPVFMNPENSFGLLLEVAASEEYYPHPFFRGDGTFTGMAHVGIAARSYEEQHHLWEDIFGLPQNHSRTRGDQPRTQDPAQPRLGPDDPVHLTEYPIGGCIIEISVPLDTESGTARYVAQRAPLGAAFHHICPWAPDVHKAVDRGNAGGLQQIGAVPPPEQTRQVVAWFHPRTSLGTLMEIWNRPEM